MDICLKVFIMQAIPNYQIKLAHELNIAHGQLCLEVFEAITNYLLNRILYLEDFDFEVFAMEVITDYLLNLVIKTCALAIVVHPESIVQQFISFSTFSRKLFISFPFFAYFFLDSLFAIVLQFFPFIL